MRSPVLFSLTVALPRPVLADSASLPAQIHAEKSPFLVERLKVWMLPTLALIRKEKTVDYVVGFDDLGGKDDFTTQACPVVVRTRH